MNNLGDKKNSFNEIRYSTWKLGPGDKPRVDRIVNLVGNNKTVLDVGCGIGQIGKLLIENENRVYGVDISPSAVRKATIVGLSARHFDVEEGDIPFRNNYFDTVLAAEIIEHVFDTDAFLEKLKRKLKKNGELIITTPNIAALGRRLLLLIGRNPLIEVNLIRYSAGHIRYFVKDTLYALLESHGFEIVYFSSDVVNITADGKIHSTLLASLFPTFGRTLIIKAVKK